MKLSRIGLVLAVLLLACTTAYADGTTLTFLGPTANGEYGPYTMSLNGGAPVQMICFSEQNWIQAGESWYVQAFNPFSSLTDPAIPVGTSGSVHLTVAQYNELGFLADQLFANPGSAILQNEIWGVINGTFAATAPSWYHTTDTFYIPVGGPNGMPKVLGTPPQPFIATAVPEPSTFVLLGAAIFGLLVLSLKKAVI